MLGAGAAGMLVECVSGACDVAEALPIAGQAVIVAAAGGALLVAAYLVIRDTQVARLVLFWTLPAFVFHVIVVFLDPDESVFFPLVTAVAPLLAGATLLWSRRRPDGYPLR